jgi:cytochrome c556
MVNGRVPFDAKLIGEQIDIVAMINRLQFAAFVEGSGKGDTKALPEIWTAKDKWAAAVAKSQEDVQKLAAVGHSGNLEQIKAAAGAVGQSCKACHDTFRAK